MSEIPGYDVGPVHPTDVTKAPPVHKVALKDLLEEENSDLDIDGNKVNDA